MNYKKLRKLIKIILGIAIITIMIFKNNNIKDFDKIVASIKNDVNDIKIIIDKENVTLIKISQNVKERKVRVMSDKKIEGKIMEATVEDGYLWISR